MLLMESQWVHGWLGSIYAFLCFPVFFFFSLLAFPSFFSVSSIASRRSRGFRVERAGSGSGLLPFRATFRVFFETSLVLYTHTHTPTEEVLGFHALLLGNGRAFAFIVDARRSRARISGSLSVLADDVEANRETQQ